MNDKKTLIKLNRFFNRKGLKIEKLTPEEFLHKENKKYFSIQHGDLSNCEFFSLDVDRTIIVVKDSNYGYGYEVFVVNDDLESDEPYKYCGCGDNLKDAVFIGWMEYEMKSYEGMLEEGGKNDEAYEEIMKNTFSLDGYMKSMRKRVCKNPNQGIVTKILCVCSAGLLRSPTLAEELQKRGYNTRSAGITPEYALIEVDDVLMEWADIVLCVHPQIEADVKIYFKEYEDKIQTLKIPDQYDFRSETLKMKINEQLDNLNF